MLTACAKQMNVYPLSGIIPKTGPVDPDIYGSIREFKMPDKEGLVLNIKENGLARVVTRREQACDGCGSSACCPAMGATSSMVIEALNRAGAGAGDSVRVSMKPRSPVKSAAILYMIPTAGLVAGVVFSSYLTRRWSMDETTLSMILSLGGLVLGFMISFLINSWLARTRGYAPVVTRILCRGLKGAYSTTDKEPGPGHSLKLNQDFSTRQGGKSRHSCLPDFRKKPEHRIIHHS
jgi:positive regulator of sigma E activity